METKPICFLNQKMKFNEAFNFMIQGEKMRCLSWHKNYFIFINNEQIYDYMNNLFAYDKDIYFNCNTEILEHSDHKWEVYSE